MGIKPPFSEKEGTVEKVHFFESGFRIYSILFFIGCYFSKIYHKIFYLINGKWTERNLLENKLDFMQRKNFDKEDALLQKGI